MTNKDDWLLVIIFSTLLTRIIYDLITNPTTTLVAIGITAVLVTPILLARHLRRRH